MAQTGSGRMAPDACFSICCIHLPKISRSGCLYVVLQAEAAAVAAALAASKSATPATCSPRSPAGRRMTPRRRCPLHPHLHNRRTLCPAILSCGICRLKHNQEGVERICP